MPEQVHYAADDLPRDLRIQLTTQQRISWEIDFDSLFDDFPPEYHPSHLMLVEGDLMISHVGLIRIVLEHGGETYDTWGISGVFTFPTARSKGYSSQLLHASNAVIDADADADLSILWCAPEKIPFYGRFGYERLTGTETRYGAGGQLVNSEPIMARFISQKARTNRVRFENASLYVGPFTW